MNTNLFHLSSYHYELPEELIAQHPVTPRDHSRLMVVDRAHGTVAHHHFYELPKLLQSGDALVFNDTKVIPARLLGRRSTGGQAEVFLTRQLDNSTWETMVRPGRKVREGAVIVFGDDLRCEIIAVNPDGTRQARFDYEGNFDDVLHKHGSVPLPPYIQRAQEQAADTERYQTVYAANPGAVAAPTAGLHFTEDTLQQLRLRGVAQHSVTLHVGLGTFLPVQTHDIREHRMHRERIIIPAGTAEALNVHTGRTICVGTTCCRSLETAATAEGKVVAGEYDSDIFIYPGYAFKKVGGLLTNFHLPGSTLLMLVSAFAGYELAMRAYHEAVANKYRFFSYGDAMLIL